MSKEKQFIGLDKDGFEHPDPRPVEIPTRLKLPQRQIDRVREVVRRELSLAAEEQGWESFEEADDFDLPGEDPISPYEEVFEPQGVVDSPAPHVAANKGEKDGKRVEGDGHGKAGDRVGAGSGDKVAGKAERKAGGPAGSNGGAGRAGEGDKGDQSED